MKFKQMYKSLNEIAKENRKNYSIKQFHGAGNMYSHICRHKIIVIPKEIQTNLVEWSHNVLYHPGEPRT